MKFVCHWAAAKKGNEEAGTDATQKSKRE